MSAAARARVADVTPPIPTPLPDGVVAIPVTSLRNARKELSRERQPAVSC